MIFLIRDVLAEAVNVRMRHRECTVPAPPREPTFQQPIVINPVGRTALQQLHSLLNAQVGRQVDQRMSMIAVEVIDPYVDAFLLEYSERLTEALAAARLSSIGSRRSVSQIR